MIQWAIAGKVAQGAQPSITAGKLQRCWSVCGDVFIVHANERAGVGRGSVYECRERVSVHKLPHE